MKEFQNHRRSHRLLSSRPVQMLLLLVVIMMGKSVWQFYQRERTVAAEEKSLRRELLALAARRDELAADVARLETDRGVEEEIRERFGVVKEGEKVINLVGETVPAPPAAAVVPWWRALWNRFFGE